MKLLINGNVGDRASVRARYPRLVKVFDRLDRRTVLSLRHGLDLAPRPGAVVRACQEYATAIGLRVELKGFDG